MNEENKKFLEELKLTDYSKLLRPLSEQEALKKLKDIHKNVKRSACVEYLLLDEDLTTGTQSI